MNSGVLLFDTVSVHWATQHGDFNTVVIERVVPTVKDTIATAAAADITAVETVEAVDENDQVALADANDSDCDGTATAAAAAVIAEPSYKAIVSAVCNVCVSNAAV
jgi:hypothetical protein